MFDPLDPATAKALAALPDVLKDDPELAAKLAQATSSKARLLAMDEKIAALSLDATERTTSLRAAYREKHAARFADLDPKKALIGLPVDHRIVFKDTAAFLVRPPSAKATKAIELEAATLGLRDFEIALVTWVQSVDLSAIGGPVTTLSGIKPADALEYLRRFPEALLVRLARECDELANYLNVCLELDLGN